MVNPAVQTGKSKNASLIRYERNTAQKKRRDYAFSGSEKERRETRKREEEERGRQSSDERVLP